ncbi:GNAT family N-acetyltransferase [Chromobacterium sp. IIBBL 290-4]|uniref:bifunctional helix-turn-helix transcriptional regulator/GNAT family N-acetyltransferase n=1 Tax=Chromobacterium sp. IIBBL 290-4 TaxID=2953890 RepID=UPI0020B7944D|nr:GNAT family N-acetyltransferase [Chromobacterium sp. IIBBL 290-4]UTH72459.1 bifunctional helix-turn-helix transcriptional regulator/GNAT family N-acetyltransferase [Chromobacterium sp. IIBBL 290-4]
MNERELRALSRDMVRELGMLSSHCGAVELTPVEAHLLIELESGPASNQQLADRLRVDKSNSSRPLQRLYERGLVVWRADPADGRSKLAALTEEGCSWLRWLHAAMDADMARVLAQLDEAERLRLEDGLSLFRRALRHADSQQGYTIRPLALADNGPLAALIRKVSAEYRLGEGCSVHDPQLDALFQVYNRVDSRYLAIIAPDGRLLGGGGIAPLAGGGKGVCELQKMYFDPDLRGKGLGRRVLRLLLAKARALGYRQCYLETTSALAEATALYRAEGFVQLDARWGATGHGGCEICMARDL